MTTRIIDAMSATEPDAIALDHERRFHALVDQAEQIEALFDRLLQVSRNNELQSRVDMQGGLLFELGYLSRLQLDAVCHDLRHPWMSHAAATHPRPLLEGIALVAPVLGHETDHPLGTSEQRAVVRPWLACARNSRP